MRISKLKTAERRGREEGDGREGRPAGWLAGWLVRFGRNPEMIADPNGIDFGTKTYRFGHFSGPSYRGAHAGWPAARLGGQLGRRLAGCGGALISRRNRCAFAPAKLT